VTPLYLTTDHYQIYSCVIYELLNTIRSILVSVRKYVYYVIYLLFVIHSFTIEVCTSNMVYINVVGYISIYHSIISAQITIVVIHFTHQLSRNHYHYHTVMSKVLSVFSSIRKRSISIVV